MHSLFANDIQNSASMTPHAKNNETKMCFWSSLTRCNRIIRAIDRISFRWLLDDNLFDIAFDVAYLRGYFQMKFRCQVEMKRTNSNKATHTHTHTMFIARKLFQLHWSLCSEGIAVERSKSSTDSVLLSIINVLNFRSFQFLGPDARHVLE